MIRIPALSSPVFSASVIMLMAIRSFTDPSGLKNSSLKRTRAGRPRVSFWKGTRGVDPMVSRMED